MADDSNIEIRPLEDLHSSFAEFKQDNSTSDLVVVAAHRCADDGEWKAMLDAFMNPENEEVLRYVGWELIGLLTKSRNLSNVEHCTCLLDTITEVCSPKEVILGVVEGMDTTLSTESFIMVLSPLQKAFSKLKGKRSKFMKMILPKISRHIRKLEMGDSDHATLNTSQDSCPSAKHDLCSVLLKVITLVGFLVQDTTGFGAQEKIDDSVDTERDLQSWELVKCLIEILELLATKDLNPGPGEGESYSDCGIRIAALLCDLQYTAVRLTEYALEYSSFSQVKQTSFPKMLDSEDSEGEEETENESLPSLGVACYSYLSFVQDVGYVPQVFKPDYLLKINLPGIACLLQRSHPQTNKKGIELLSCLTDRVGKGSLGHHYLRFEGFLRIPKALRNIMVYGSLKELRIQATNLLQNFIAQLDTRGRYVLIRYLLLDCGHAGVAALLIQKIKDEVHCNLNSPYENDSLFRGKQLISLLYEVCKVPHGMGADSDLVPETERVMASLNCLRYILLRDKDDKTTLWKTFSMFEKEFLNPLRESINLTRLRYRAVQNQKEDDARDKNKRDEKKIDFTVTTPDGTPISAMSDEDQAQVLRSGLYALDMMDCILAHIDDIVSKRN